MNAREFKREIFKLFYQDIHRLEPNNYSYQRFSYDGVDRSQIFDLNKQTMFLDWFTDNYEGIFTAWSRLSDAASRDLYVDLIRFRIAGHLHVRIRSQMEERRARAERVKEALSATPSALSLSGMFGQLVHYRGSWEGVEYEVDTVPDGLMLALGYGQYYYDRDGVIIAPRPGDIVVDAGAFTGETSIIFGRTVGRGGRVFSFDPVAAHQRICALNFARGCDNVEMMPYAVGDRIVDAPAVESDEYNPGYRASTSTVAVPTRRIDDLVMEGRIPRVDFLKMDVEGAELDALRGATSTIVHFRPRLALSIYHKPNDFFEIINFVHDLGLGYSLHVDHHTIFEEETVLYASAPSQTATMAI